MFNNFMGGLASGGVHDVFDFSSDEFLPEMDFGVEFGFGGDTHSSPR